MTVSFHVEKHVNWKPMNLQKKIIWWGDPPKLGSCTDGMVEHPSLLEDPSDNYQMTHIALNLFCGMQIISNFTIFSINGVYVCMGSGFIFITLSYTI